MIFLTIFIYTINLAWSNKKENTNDCEIKDNKTYSIVLLALIGISLLFDIISTRIRFPIYIYLILSIIESIYFIFENTKRQQVIRKKHEEMRQVLQCLAPILNVPKGEELDIEGDYGLELIYDEKKGDLTGIKCEMQDPDKWTDQVVTKIVLNLNKFISNKKWISNIDYPSLTGEFIGTEPPPTMAKYAGSWLRPWNFIPIGVDGNNELGVNLGAKKKNLGESSFKYEDGRIAEAYLSPKVAQCLVAGSTGGGKSIFIDQRINIR